MTAYGTSFRGRPEEVRLVVSNGVASRSNGAGAALLRVGRALQPAAFWERLVPDDRLRNLISREHFEVLCDGSELVLDTLGSAGTLVNGVLVRQRRPLRS